MTNFADIIDVTPRDGIQNERRILDMETKLELIARGARAGVRRVEATSFVNPAKVPQMADANAVAAALPRNGGQRYIGLALNRRGAERAANAGLDEANFVIVASDTFNRRNQGVGTLDSLRAFADLAAAPPGGLAMSVTIGAAFGCPFEGEVPLSRLMQVVEACAAAGPAELALADTIGVATPRDIAERLAAIQRSFPDLPLRLHLHNTRNTGIANAWAALEAGVTRFDASFGGVGGCPFAPRATGNIAIEDLVYMLDRSGVTTGIDLDAAIETAEWLEARLGKTAPGMVMKAGGFPRKGQSG